MKSVDVYRYLERIKFQGKFNLSLSCLTKLQYNHLLNIPFENLDIHYGRKIKLRIDKLFKKIILDQRGGFCYELNGLFYEFLISMGFEAKRISARVYSQERGYGEEFDHLAILVNLGNEEYLADVGFGEFAFSPLKFELGTKQQDSRGVFFFDKHNDNYFRINKIEHGKSVPQYIFTTKSRKLSEFEGMCNYHQTSPDSHFTHKKTISIPTMIGRITLKQDKIKITEKGKIFESPVSGKSEFDKLLWEHFKLRI